MARWFRSQRSFARYCALTAIATPACWSRAAGIPVHVMAARLGHADPAVTSRIYSHVLREHTLGVGDVFAQAVKASVGKSASQTGEDYQ